MQDVRAQRDCIKGLFNRIVDNDIATADELKALEKKARSEGPFGSPWLVCDLSCRVRRVCLSVSRVWCLSLRVCVIVVAAAATAAG